MFAAIIATIKRDLIYTFRNPMSMLNPLIFFVLITVLFPLAVTSDPKKLLLIGPGVIWIAIVFATMLNAEYLFTPDYLDGTLEQMALNPVSLAWLVCGKVILQWLTMIVPLLVATLVLSQFFFLPFQGVIVLIVSLILGSPVLTFISALGNALTLGLANRGIVLVLLILPLFIPVLIFGSGAVNDAILGLPVTSQLAFLAAFLTLTLTFAPLAIAAALRISLE